MPNPSASAPSVDMQVEAVVKVSLSDEPTTISGYAMAIAKALDHSGIDSNRMLQAVGITRTLSNDPLSRLPVATLTRLYRACVEVTLNPYFGLTVARFIQVSNLHALGYALVASTNLLEFCRRLATSFRLASQTAEITVVESNDTVTLKVQHLVEVCAETEDALMGFVFLSMRQLYRADFTPVRVALHHAMPRVGDGNGNGAGPYEKFFKASVAFSAPVSELVLRKSDALYPLMGACAELAQLNDNLAARYMAHLDKNDVVTVVKQKIIEFLPSGDCSREKIASTLCMSASTLQFKLAHRETNFHDLLEAIRHELALSYVKQASLTITEITFLLGFSDTSNFTRAFKRWEGVSPSEFRQRIPPVQSLTN